MHSHVGRNLYQCGFSQHDIHTHKTWSNVYPDILSLVVHVGDDKSIMNYDFYAITEEGQEKLNKCTNPSYCNCNGYKDPEKKLNYKSCLEFLKFTEDNLKIREIKIEDPMMEKPLSKKPKLISSEHLNVSKFFPSNDKNKLISSIDFTAKHSILSTQINAKILKKISLDSYLIGDSTQTCKLKLDPNLSILEEGKSYKILFKDTIFEEKCIVVTDETDLSELYDADIPVPYDVAIKIDKKIITPKAPKVKIF